MAFRDGHFIAVGDIHGCPVQLDEILELTAGYQDHRYVFLGDYIHRGPDSEAVIDRIRGMDAVFLMGNHEEMLLDRLDGADPGAFERLLNQSGLSPESLSWIRGATRPIFETDSCIFVHGGLDKGKTLEEQTTRDYLWSYPDSDYFDLTPKWVVHGHLAVPEPDIDGNRININTGCGNRGRLTALVMPEMIFVASSVSPGENVDWPRLRMELAEELAQFDAWSASAEPAPD